MAERIQQFISLSCNVSEVSVAGSGEPSGHLGTLLTFISLLPVNSHSLSMDAL